MGIKGFRAFLKANFPNAFTGTHTKSLSAQEIYIDFNPYIHQFSRRKNEYQLMASLKSCIEQQFSSSKVDSNYTKYFASDLLYFAVDGPAALAKVDLQRERREESGIEAIRKCQFDAQQITPGTIFMRKYSMLN
jgi:5'-3' exonuclease